MSEAMDNNLVTLTDEDGVEMEFEHIDTIEMDGETYLAFIPANLAVEDEAEVVVLKVVEENGEEILISIDNEDELMTAYNKFMERVEEMYEFDENAE